MKDAEIRAELERQAGVIVTDHDGEDCLAHALAGCKICTIQHFMALERERCAKLVDEFEDWVWPDKKSEAYREAGDWAGPDTAASLQRLAAVVRQGEKPTEPSPICGGCGAPGGAHHCYGGTCRCAECT